MAYPEFTLVSDVACASYILSTFEFSSIFCALADCNSRQIAQCIVGLNLYNDTMIKNALTAPLCSQSLQGLWLEPMVARLLWH